MIFKAPIGRHWRAFYEVAKSLSFSIAAENLYVSQPAVTKQIKMFEEHWNLKLFLILSLNWMRGAAWI